jgi:hypothetical protein
VRDLAAVLAALDLAQKPRMLRARKGPSLPGGMTVLLEIAVGEPESLRFAVAETERTPEVLREVAGFYIEQVLLDGSSDPYRVLGCAPDASAAELRRHMALLIRWAHPDAVPGRRDGMVLDRSIFADQITAAWESLKTPERRMDHDRRAVAAAIRWPEGGDGAWPAAPEPPARPLRAMPPRAPVRRPSLWRRIRNLFRRKRR